MSLIDDIKAKRDEALEIIDDKILVASSAGLEGAVEQLQAKRREIAKAALAAILAAPNLQAAFEVLKNATKELNDVAENLKIAADFATKLAGFLEKAKAVGDVIKNGGNVLV
jgi:hypothetical protein